MDDYSFLKNPVLSRAEFIASQWNPYASQCLGVLDNRQPTDYYYRPLTHIFYDFSYATFKNHYWEYHLLNLALFVFASSLVFLLMAKMTGNRFIAFLAGLFYLIHPINGIIVNYISAGVFAFQVIFMLAAILLLLESLDRNNDRKLYFLSLLSGFMSLFWHENGIMTPLYISAVVFLFGKGNNKAKISSLTPYFLLVFAYIAFRFCFTGINKSMLQQITLSQTAVWDYPAGLFKVFSWYITRLFYPAGIVMQWATPVVHEQVLWNDIGALALLLFFLLAFIRLSGNKICRLALVWIFIGFIPASVAVFRSFSVGLIIEPHWFVFSSIGFFILAASFFQLMRQRTKKVASVLLLTVILAWGAVSHAYNPLWKDQKTYALYWSQAVPHYKLIDFYIADAYQQEGAYKESKEYFRRALAGDSSDFPIFNNLGVMEEQQGNLKEAELNYRMALRIEPHSAYTFNNMGQLYLQQNQMIKAREYFAQAMIYDPFLLQPRRALASIYLKHSEYQKAINLCLKNLAIDHDDMETLFLLIDLYARQKDFLSLKKCAYRIIAGTTQPELLSKLGNLMGEQGMVDIAIDSYIKAIRVAPHYQEAYLNAGTLLGNMGKYDDAIRLWQLGLEIDPSDGRFKSNIAEARRLSTERIK